MLPPRDPVTPAEYTALMASAVAAVRQACETGGCESSALIAWQEMNGRLSKHEQCLVRQRVHPRPSKARKAA